MEVAEQKSAYVDFEMILRKSPFSPRTALTRLTEKSAYKCNKRITIEAMTPTELKNHGDSLKIHFDYLETPFGEVLIASTGKGICYLAFVTDPSAAFKDLSQLFPRAHLLKRKDPLHPKALHFFDPKVTHLDPIPLHIKGTPFQIKVWQALLQIPKGSVCSYSNIAQFIGNPKASRAVGSAIANNPVAYLVPCHRVIQASGLIGQYRWGRQLKATLINWEMEN